MDTIEIIHYCFSQPVISLWEIERYAPYTAGKLPQGTRLKLTQDHSPRVRAGDAVHLLGDNKHMDKPGQQPRKTVQVYHPRTRQTVNVDTSKVGISRRELAMHTGRDRAAVPIHQAVRSKQKTPWVQHAASRAVAVKSRNPLQAGKAWAMYRDELHELKPAEVAGLKHKDPNVKQATWHQALGRLWDEHAKKMSEDAKAFHAARERASKMSEQEFTAGAETARLHHDKGHPRLAHHGLSFALKDNEHDSGTPVVGPQEILARVYREHFAPKAAQASAPQSAPAAAKPAAVAKTQAPQAKPVAKGGLPPVPAGHVRMYHGGTKYAGGKRWLSPDRSYAEGYVQKTPGASLHYVDVPENHPQMRKAFDDTGTDQKAPWIHFEADESLSRQLKPVGAQSQITPPRAGPSQPKPAASSKPGDMTDEQLVKGLRDLGWPDAKINTLDRTTATNIVKGGARMRPQPKKKPAQQQVAEAVRQVPPREGQKPPVPGDMIPGGKADTKQPATPQALSQGAKVEAEHTSSPAVAKEIAKDHLTEDPTYYDKLKKMEAAPVDHEALYQQAKAFKGMVPPDAPKELKRAVYLVRNNIAKNASELPKWMNFMEQQKGGVLEQRDPVPETDQRRMLYEVAPDPTNKPLTKAWTALTPQERVEASYKISDEVLPKILQLHNAGGQVHRQLGGWMDETSPSFAYTPDEKMTPEQLIDLAKTTGHVLGQQAVMLLGHNPFPGAQQHSLLHVRLPSDDQKVVHDTYQAIRQASGGKINGHTTVGNDMTIAVEGMSPQELLAIARQATGDKLEVNASPGYVSFISKEDYGYATQPELHPGMASRWDAVHGLRKSVEDAIHEWISRSHPGAGQEILGGGDGGGAGVPDAGARLTARHHPVAGRTLSPILDPGFHGTGIKGQEAGRRQKHGPLYPDRTYLYTGQTPPESGLDPNQKAEFQIPSHAMLDLSKAPYDFWHLDVEDYARKHGLDPADDQDMATAIDAWAKEHGYLGVHNPSRGVGYVFHPLDTSQSMVNWPQPRRPEGRQDPTSFREYAEPAIQSYDRAMAEAGIPEDQRRAMKIPFAQQLRVAYDNHQQSMRAKAVDPQNVSGGGVPQSGFDRQVAGKLNQVEDILRGGGPEPFQPDPRTRNAGRKRKQVLSKVRNFLVKFARRKGNRVVDPRTNYATPEGRERATQQVVQHTLQELQAWRELTGGKYKSFYTEDIIGKNGTNDMLQAWGKQKYGRELTPAEIRFIHMLSAYGSGGTNPAQDTQNGMKVFAEYMAKGKATGYTDKPAQVYKAPATGQDTKPVYIDSATGKPTFEAAGNKPLYKDHGGQVSKTYNVTGLGRFNNVLAYFGGDLTKTMDWLGSMHTPQEIAAVVGPDVFKKAKPHEYLSKGDGDRIFGIFALGDAPKHGSYVLNRWQELGTITKDMWVARTMSRYFGEPRIYDQPWGLTKTGQSKNVHGQWGLVKRRILDDAWTRVGKQLGVQPAIVQEMMWDAEKRLYEILGARDDTKYTSQGVDSGKHMVEQMYPSQVQGMLPGFDNLQQNEAAGGVRSTVRGTYNPRSRITELVKQKADLTTAIHEAGHWFHQVLDQHPEYGALMREHYGDYDPIQNRYGLEQFARHLEDYFKTGVAAVPGLKRVYEAIKQWMISLFRQRSTSYGEMHPSIRQMLDTVHSDTTDPYVQQLIQEFDQHVPAERFSAGLPQRVAASGAQRYTAGLPERFAAQWSRFHSDVNDPPPPAEMVDQFRHHATNAIVRRPPAAGGFPVSHIQHPHVKAMAQILMAARKLHRNHETQLRNLAETLSPGVLEHVDRHFTKLHRSPRMANA